MGMGMCGVTTMARIEAGRNIQKVLGISENS